LLGAEAKAFDGPIAIIVSGGNIDAARWSGIVGR
jgi:hypothetical protein